MTPDEIIEQISIARDAIHSIWAAGYGDSFSYGGDLEIMLDDADRFLLKARIEARRIAGGAPA